MNPIPYGRQNITDEDIQAVIEVLKSDYLTQGPKIPLFEKAFANYIGCKYAIAVANGTAALHLCALALNVKEGDDVITTPITFAASANCIKYAGGNVVFADIDPETYLIDYEKVKILVEKSKGRIKGIIPVDFAGRAVNLEIFRRLAIEYNLWIIEDACHAPGGYFIDSKGDKQLCGNCNYADLAIFSFHPVKHIACGEGGMITTNNFKLYQKLILLRTHGITKDPNLLLENHGDWYYEMHELGFNYRLTDFQAALGISQLKRLDESINKRIRIAKIYYNSFKDKKYILSQSTIISGHSYHLYIINVNDRKGLFNFLRSHNVFAQVHYIPVHLLPYYQQLGSKVGDLPKAESYYEKCISLPMFPTLTEEEQLFVINKIDNYYG